MLEGKRAIITGAGMGMGRAAAIRFVGEGARVGLIDRDEAAVADTAAEIERAGGEGLVLVADVTDEDQVAGAVERAVAAWGGLDVVVANAGVQLAGQDDRADRLSLEVWQRTIDINLTGVFLTCKHGLRALLATGGGCVVCTCSPTGQYGVAPGYDAYSSSKAGVYGLVRVMAADYAADAVLAARRSLAVQSVSERVEKAATSLTRHDFAAPRRGQGHVRSKDRRRDPHPSSRRRRCSCPN